MNECNGPPRIDRCSGCSIYNDDSNQILTHCESGKWLSYVQVPRNISINDFVSSPNLLGLYSNSNLELNPNGISGRACLNDTIRFDLQRLNATIQPIANTKKWEQSVDKIPDFYFWNLDTSQKEDDIIKEKIHKYVNSQFWCKYCFIQSFAEIVNLSSGKSSFANIYIRIKRTHICAFSIF